MELIPYDEFSRLRLREFCPPDAEIDDLGEDLEYMGRTWYGEGIKGVDFLWQRKSHLDCILLSLQPKFCPSEVEQAILAAIHLPLKRGLTFAAVRRLLGAPAKRDSGSDWETVTFHYGRKWPYFVLTDFGSKTGLRNLDIARLDALPRKEDREV